MFDFAEVFTVYAGTGKEKKKFTLHESFAIKTSKYFKQIIANQQSDDVDKRAVNTAQTAETFGIYAQWLYSGNIITQRDDDYLDHDCDWNVAGKEFDPPSKVRPLQQLMELYVLGQELGDPIFANRITDLTIEHLTINRVVPPVEVLRYLWDSIEESCAMKHVLGGFWGKLVTRHHIAHWFEELRHDDLLFSELVEHLVSFRHAEPHCEYGPSYEGRKVYHQADKDGPPYPPWEQIDSDFRELDARAVAPGLPTLRRLREESKSGSDSPIPAKRAKKRKADTVHFE